MVYYARNELETARDGVHEITREVMEAVRESRVSNGVCVVETTDASAGILKISGCGTGTEQDLVREMRRIVPARINFANQNSPDDAAGRLKSAYFGSSVSLIVKEGKLICLGEQGVFFAEYDGTAHRNYSVCVVGE